MSRIHALLLLFLLCLTAAALAPAVGAGAVGVGAVGVGLAPTPTAPTATPTIFAPQAQGIGAEAELVCRLKSEAVARNELLSRMSSASCTDGMAGPYPCQDVDLLSLVPSAELNPAGVWGSGLNGNDLWGWYHPETGAEYALVGLRKGVAFVNVSAPTAPVVEAFHPAAVEDPAREIWRDVRSYDRHAFIVSEMAGHGMQVVDMAQLPTITEVARYTGFGSAHNIAINEASGFAYIVGAREFAEPQQRSCAGGLHVVDIRDPQNPTFAGCFESDGYTHDAQCVVYPANTPYAGQEICFAYNEDTLTIVDVSDKADMRLLARVPYQGARYTHQGWLTEDYRYLLMDDEQDELLDRVNTHTYVWDVSDLSHPRHIDTVVSESSAIDHDQYIRGDFSFQSNYRAGLRILNVASISDSREVGYFDIYPQDDAPSFNGAWGAYPFLPSGNILVNGIEQGLFVLRPKGNAIAPDFDVETPVARAQVCQGQSASLPVNTRALYGYQGTLSLTLTGVPAAVSARAASWSVQAGQSLSLTIQAGSSASGSSYLTLSGSDGRATRQQVIALDVRSVPQEAPVLLSPLPGASEAEVVTFGWQPTPGAIAYRLQVARDANFTDLLLDETIAGTSVTRSLPVAPLYHWRVVAQNDCGGGPASEARTFTGGGSLSLWLPITAR